MELQVYNLKGEATGRNIQLDDQVFGLEQPNDHAIYLDVRQIQANHRQGTHKAKERGEVSFSTKKLYRQKGTGNARPGSKKSPLYRHGGRIFGPRPRDYGFSLNKKVKSLARRSALTYKVREEKLVVLETLTFDAPKTKQFIDLLSNFKLQGAKTLVVLENYDQNVYLSGRNLPKAMVMAATDLNTYDILNADSILLTEGAANLLNERFA